MEGLLKITEGVIHDIVAQAVVPIPGDDGEWLEGLNVTKERYYRFLYHLVMALRPDVAVEIGVEGGVASAHMAVAASRYGGHVVGIDLHSSRFLTEKLPSVANYHFIAGDSTSDEVVARVAVLVAEHGQIGLVYQDSSHHYQASCDEWSAYTGMCNASFVWVCDDITPAFHDPRVDPPGRGMVYYFNERPGTKLKYPNILHFGNTIGVIIIDRGEQDGI
jgi:cephalosporin hydroxylase